MGLSAEQRKLVLYHQLFPGDTSFTLPHVERIRGDVDVPRLRDALEFILAESAGLNTVFRDGPDGYVAVRHPGRPTVPILDAPPAPDAEAEAAAVTAEVARSAARVRPPHEWPLYEAALYRGRDHTYLTLVCSHLVSDAITLYNIAEMASKLYRNPPLTPDYLAGLTYLPVNTLSPQRTARAVEAFREMLAGVTQLTHEGLADRRRRDGALPGVYRQEPLPAELDAALRTSELVRQCGAYSVFVAAHAVVLSALAGRPHVVVGVPMATRRNWRQMYALGYFVNTLPLAVDLDETPTFADLCELVAGRVRTMLRHKLLDLGAQAGQVFPGRRMPSLHLDNAITIYRKTFPLDLPGCTSETLFVPRDLVRYPLAVNVRESDQGYEVGVEYAHRLAPADPPALLVQVLRGAVADPLAPLSGLCVVGPEEDLRIDALVNDYRPGRAVETVDEWFAGTAREHPGRTAVTDPAGSYTYAELDEAASRVAAALDRSGHTRHVAVAMRPRRELVAVLLGVLRSGRAYVPLDLNAPAERVRHILGQFGEVSLVADDGALPDVAVALRQDPARLLTGRIGETGHTGTRPGAEDVAYVIFTSGSTGVPKGVEVTHRNVTRLLSACDEHYDFDENDVWCLFHSYAFDFSVWEMLGALLHGGRLVVPAEEAVRSPVGFARLLADEGVTVLNQTPSAFRRLTGALDEELAARLAVRWVIFGGEALRFDTPAPWTRLTGGRARLANMYGITETTVHTTFHEISPDSVGAETGSVIGRPLGHLRVFVVDRNLNRCPVGVPGEILVAGDGVARGYLGRPDLTAERFLTGTRYGERVYRSGDRAFVAENGDLVYLDRVDRQVQLRGYRIEPGEVESAVRLVPGVKDAHVNVYRPGDGEPLLIAWLVCSPDAPDDPGIRAALAGRLPAYMMPGRYVRVPELPLTVNGKVDVAALPVPADDPAAGRAGTGDELVDAVVRIWTEVTHCAAAGPDDSFFEVGGTSMHVMRVHRRLTEDLRVEGLDVIELFEYPTPRLLAARLRRGLAGTPLAEGPSADGPSARRAGARRAPSAADRRLARAAARRDRTPPATETEEEAGR